jgi:hypothetical protein
MTKTTGTILAFILTAFMAYPADLVAQDVAEVKEELELSKSQLEDIGSRIAAADSGPKGTECPGCRGKSKIVKQCYYCEGTGRCSKCRGTGRVRKSGAKQQSSTVVHALCRGTGKCPRCKSEGQEEVVCRECKGTGIKP